MIGSTTSQPATARAQKAPPGDWPRVELLAPVSSLPALDVPGATLSNVELSELMGRIPAELSERGIDREIELSTPEFPLERLGVRSRGVLDAAWSTRGLALDAARRSLSESGVDPADVRCVIVSTVTPDMAFPALATAVHRDLALAPEADAFDVTIGCSGFLVALGIAARRLASEPEGAAALVVASEAMVRLADASDRATCTIFGDGAGAVVLRRSARVGVHPVHTWTLGEHGPRIEARAPADGAPSPLFRFTARAGRLAVEEDHASRHRLVLDGRRVFRDMVRTLPGLIRAYLDREQLSLAEVDHVLFHQANQRMVEAVASAPELGLGAERVPSNIAEVGNTASASLPILLAASVRSGRISPGDRALLVGFGSGYSIAIAHLTV